MKINEQSVDINANSTKSQLEHYIYPKFQDTNTKILTEIHPNKQILLTKFDCLKKCCCKSRYKPSVANWKACWLELTSSTNSRAIRVSSFFLRNRQ